MPEWIVIKFGGTSVSSKSCWQSIAEICTTHLQVESKLVVICSAAAGVSNLLEKMVTDALSGSFSQAFDAIKAIYQRVAAELEIDIMCVDSDFAKLFSLCEGIQLLGELSPRTQASIMAFGEIILTKIGYEYLSRHISSLSWLDARDVLHSNDSATQQTQRHYLAACCDAEFDASFGQSLDKLKGNAIITQGFIASDEAGDTVLLGRGGSDVSAAYIAAKLGAKHCEIWTDVPGIYTANPHEIPQARLLKQLDFDEAQEIAAMGGKILHPNTIPPLRQAAIPLKIKQTSKPNAAGSLVTMEPEQGGLRIKSVLTKYPVTLISIETLSMWRQSGFLAEVFNCFARYDVSIDLITTSESSVTVTLDDPHVTVDSKRFNHLVVELKKFSHVTVVNPCAQVSLVGRNIRDILPDFSPVFEAFEAQQVYMLSQSANNLNLSFIVAEDQAPKIAKKLHAMLIENNHESFHYSKSWQEEFLDLPQLAPDWWRQSQNELLEYAKNNSPCYVYNEETLIDSVNQLKNCSNLDRIFFAVKANPNSEILKIFYDHGIGFECVSIGEVTHILNLFPDIARDRLLFTPNFASRDEYQAVIEKDIHVTIDAVYPLIHWPNLFKGKDILLRIDPGVGFGHHKYVCTGGNASKFGIQRSKLQMLSEHVKQHGINVVGLHVHYGSGILQSDLWQGSAKLLSSLIDLFPNVHIFDLGGGLGIVEKPGQLPLDIQAFNESLSACKNSFPNIQLWLEPGRFLVAKAGVMLAKVTQLKQKDDTHFIGVETGMNSLIRPALYGSYHEIVNLSRLNEKIMTKANVVGPICESGDTLGRSCHLPETYEGDVMLIANTGAYGYAMSSQYNLRKPAKEYTLRSRSDVSETVV